MLKKWCEVTSCSGVSDLYEAKDHKGKLTFWFIVMTCSLGLTVWFTYNTVLGYIASPTVTSVRIVSQTALGLPDITLCYNGGLNVSAMKLENWSNELITNFSVALFTEKDSGNFADARNELKLKMKSTNVDIPQLINLFSYQCDEFIEVTRSPGNISCKNAKRMIGWKGNCYSFQQRGAQNHPGNEYGVTVELRQPNNSFYELYPELASKSWMSSGFSISAGNDDIDNQISGSILVPVSVLSYIKLNPKRFVRLSQTKTCNESTSLSSSFSCFDTCYNDSFYKRCNCVHVLYWNESLTVEICDPFVFSECSPQLDDDELKACRANCLPKCDEWTYETTVTYDAFYNSPLDRPSSVVNIFYEKMQYLKVEEIEAFTFDMAVANVGGQLGLWLGVSMVTIVQALYYMFMTACQHFAIIQKKTG